MLDARFEVRVNRRVSNVGDSFAKYISQVFTTPDLRTLSCYGKTPGEFGQERMFTFPSQIKSQATKHCP